MMRTPEDQANPERIKAQDNANAQARYRRLMRRNGFREVHAWVPRDIYDEVMEFCRDKVDAERMKERTKSCLSVPVTD